MPNPHTYGFVPDDTGTLVPCLTEWTAKQAAKAGQRRWGRGGILTA